MTIEYIKNPPLIKVILELYFNRDFNLKVSDFANIFKKIQNPFNIEPNLDLIPPKGQDFQFHLGTLQYKDDDDKRILEFGSNFLIFTFNKYFENWEKLRDLIIEIIKNLKDILNYEKIKNLILTYVDEFYCIKDGFQINKYFNVNISDKFDIIFNDFHLGFVPCETDKIKVVLRLKSGPFSKDQYRFELDTTSIGRNIDLPVQIEELSNFLNNAHYQIEKYFILLLKDKQIQENIGMKIKNE